MLFALAATAWPLAVWGQQQAAKPVVAFIRSGSLDEAAPFVAAFREGLKEAGFVDGRDVVIDIRSGGGSRERVREIIEEFVRAQVAAIVGNNLATRVAKATTSTIPIVFATGTDPAKSGFVFSLNRPEGNVTGVTFIGTALIAKRIELLHELVPNAAVIGVLLDANSPQYENHLKETDEAVRTIGRKISVATVSSAPDIAPGFDTVLRDGARAVVVGNGSIFTDERHLIVHLAAGYRVPTSYAVREFVDAGGLLSYGASQKGAYRQAGSYVARILKGETPADLPVLQPTTFELVINLKAAKDLSLDIPPTLLARADEVIE